MMAGMGRLVGRRPDHTASIARALRSELAPGEQVVAGVYVQVPGVNEAAMSGGASGAVAAATGSGVAFRDVDGDQPAWVAAAGAMGIAPDDARRMTWSALALTTSRLLVARRSRLTRRVAGVVAAWPVGEIERIEVPRQREALTIHRGDRSLDFELPAAHKFLPDVYRELPTRLAEVRAATRT
jgi:hypothetical protein